jgi:hypothetical protein
MKVRTLRMCLPAEKIFLIRPLVTGVTILCLLACSSEPPEPPGEAVSLSSSDYSTTSKEEFKEWDAWETKGVHLGLNHEYQKALYCFHQALPAWFRGQALEKAKKDGDETLKKPPTDTYLQLSSLYLQLRESTWALKYADLYVKEIPVFNAPALQNRSIALYMLGRYKEALEECQLGHGESLCSILQAGVTMHQGDVEKGKEMVRQAWTEEQSLWAKSNDDANDLFLPMLPPDIVEVIQENARHE